MNREATGAGLSGAKKSAHEDDGGEEALRVNGQVEGDKGWPDTLRHNIIYISSPPRDRSRRPFSAVGVFTLKWHELRGSLSRRASVIVAGYHYDLDHRTHESSV
ncbi:hypothetical protein PGTUg99_029338 [Puccinia graminis f. sp. tritici]|uniref:Uncharacterized protein n=1 Tax=Puccinia graminis f. sp. tritici TaxID=56615 RepID=A0A5B0RDW4_PUCGR|nr:hypothetical protein PGTUg99_029338 [Puccinia graminis f. sp. tritici]